MKPQYVARLCSSIYLSEASESQRSALTSCGYLFASCSRTLASRFTQVAYTSKGTGLRDSLAKLNRICDRRLLCLRASNCLQYSALHSQRLLARVKHRLKSSLWLIPRRSLSSQHTQVSTSNLLAKQAFAPASTHPILKHVLIAFAPSFGGASC